jgi:hypothetical protein
MGEANEPLNGGNLDKPNKIHTLVQYFGVGRAKNVTGQAEVSGFPEEINLNKIITEVSEELHMPEERVRQRIDIYDGTRMIFQKGLTLSEVELSSVLKGYRKRVFSQHMDDISHSGEMSIQNGIRSFDRLKVDFEALHNLHDIFLKAGGMGTSQGKEAFQHIVNFLGKETFVLDAGIEPTRFFELLPQVLSSFTPHELEEMYAVNTSFRKKIVMEIAKELGVTIQIRGSVVRGDCRSFGNGCNANFPWIKDNDDLISPSGSDFDFKFTNDEDYQNLMGIYQAIMDDLNKQGEEMGVIITSDLGTMEDRIGGDGAPANVLSKIDLSIPKYLEERDEINSININAQQKDYIVQEDVAGTDHPELIGTVIDVSTLENMLRSVYNNCNALLSIKELKNLARKIATTNSLIEEEGNVYLGIETIEQFRIKFHDNIISKHFFANTEKVEVSKTINEFVDHAVFVLVGARRESDFLGYVTATKLWQDLSANFIFYLCNNFHIQITQAEQLITRISPYEVFSN